MGINTGKRVLVTGSHGFVGSRLVKTLLSKGFIVEEFDRHPLRKQFPPSGGIIEMESASYYGKGYEDVQHRRPSIRNARRLVGWQPVIGVRESVAATLDFFLQEHVAGLTPIEATATHKILPTKASAVAE